MTKKTTDEIRGVEYDWLASDADGNIGLFSTAGGGFAPEAFLADTDAFDAAIDALLGSPPTTKARYAAPSSDDTWQLVAERGLFAFDSDFSGGPYRQVAAPETPRRVADLPEAVSQVVRRVVLRDVLLREEREISGDRLAQASNP